MQRRMEPNAMTLTSLEAFAIPSGHRGRKHPHPVVPATKDLLTDREVGALLDKSKSTVWRLSGEGVLPKPIRIAGSSRWRRSEIEAVITRAAAGREPIAA
jgi:predicted DNA-binding transcriptional regulator AlpA